MRLCFLLTEAEVFFLEEGRWGSSNLSRQNNSTAPWPPPLLPSRHSKKKLRYHIPYGPIRWPNSRKWWIASRRATRPPLLEYTSRPGFSSRKLGRRAKRLWPRRNVNELAGDALFVMPSTHPSMQGDNPSFYRGDVGDHIILTASRGGIIYLVICSTFMSWVYCVCLKKSTNTSTKHVKRFRWEHWL